jgi:hypothetical protein
VYLTRFQTYKIVLPPQTKLKSGGGLQTDKYLPPNPFTGQFLRKDDLWDMVSVVIWSMVSGQEAGVRNLHILQWILLWGLVK